MKKGMMCLVLIAGSCVAYAGLQSSPDQLKQFMTSNQCASCDLSSVDWNADPYDQSLNHSGAKLAGANFSGSELCTLDLSQSDLSSSNFSSIDKSYYNNLVNFSRAELQNATFSQADLEYDNFSQANLSGAKFNGADLQHANLAGATGADLTGANVCNAVLPDGSIGTCP